MPSDNSLPEFIAEISSNHNKDLERSIAFIERAALCGCSGVKFQLFKIDKLFAKEVLEASIEHRRRKEWELPVDFLPKLSSKARELGLKFGCTPFYLDAVEELYEHVDFYKIASYELTWPDLLTEVARTKKPVVVSTGMAYINEVEEAISLLEREGATHITVLHCISAYPVEPGMCNLRAIATLKRAFPRCAVGWSDHSRNPAVVLRAVHRWNAELIEFHMDLDRHGMEYKMGHCWLPEEIKPVIQTIKTGLSADGDGEKAPSRAEMGDRAWRREPLDGLRPLKETRKKL